MSSNESDATLVVQGSGKSVSVFGVQVDILLTAQETGGVYSTYELGMEPGVGSPFHRHLQDEESFYVLEGTFEFICGERVETATVGSIIYLPRNIPHQFRNIGTGRGRLLGVGSPAGHERFFEDASQLGNPPDLAEALAVCRRYGMELLPPPATVNPS